MSTRFAAEKNVRYVRKTNKSKTRASVYVVTGGTMLPAIVDGKGWTNTLVSYGHKTGAERATSAAMAARAWHVRIHFRKPPPTLRTSVVCAWASQ